MDFTSVEILHKIALNYKNAGGGGGGGKPANRCNPKSPKPRLETLGLSASELRSWVQGSGFGVATVVYDFWWRGGGGGGKRASSPATSACAGKNITFHTLNLSSQKIIEKAPLPGFRLLSSSEGPKACGIRV